MDDELSESDRELRQPLFASPSPENDPNGTEREERGRNGERNVPTMNCSTEFGWNERRILVVMLSLVLCALAVNIFAIINGDWSLKEGKAKQQ